MNRQFLIVILILLWLPLAGRSQQNLVYNWSFEILKYPDSEFPCPTSGGAINEAKGWATAHSSPDYFNACSNEDWPLFGVPENRNGVQWPFEGLAYALIAGYYEPWAGTDPREFLLQELEDSLKAGVGYRWSSWVSLADSNNFAQSGIGVKFSVDDPRNWEIDDFMNCTPDVINDYDNLLEDKIGWTKIEGYFIADGGEKYMSIGLFRSDETDNIQRVDSIPPTQYDWDLAAYYIDAITLHEVSGVGLEEQSSIDNEQLTVWPNPSDQEFRATHTSRQGMLVLRELTGRVVAKTPASNESTVVSTLDVANGIYLLEFIADTGPKWHQRVVVRHS